MPKPDAAHLQTDKELAKLEKRIAKIYKEAADDLQKTIDDYFAKFAKRDAKQKARLEAGEITEQEYKQWRLAQMGRGERFKALQSRVAERYTEANETAVRYVNDATPGIYSLNRNYSAYTIEKAAGNVGFDLWGEQTVRRLIVENPEVMPYYPPEKALKRLKTLPTPHLSKSPLFVFLLRDFSGFKKRSLLCVAFSKLCKIIINGLLEFLFRSGINGRQSLFNFFQFFVC